MNIEEIKDYINSKKDKIKSGAIKATSTALVAGMLLSGGLGLTGCVKDPNNPNNTTVTTDPNNDSDTTKDPDRLGDPDYVKQEFTKPMEEYTVEEKFKICIENYLLSKGVYLSWLMLVPEEDLVKGEKYALVNAVEENKRGYIHDCDFKLDYSIYEQVKKALGTNDNLIYVSTENKELCDLIFDALYAKYKDTDIEQERQKKLEQAKNPTTPKTSAEKLDKYNEDLIRTIENKKGWRSQEEPYNVTKINIFYTYDPNVEEIDPFEDESKYLVTCLKLFRNYSKEYITNLNGEMIDIKYEDRAQDFYFPVDKELMNKIANIVPVDQNNQYILERTLDNREQWEKLCEIIAPYLAEKFPINELDEEMTR